jgi:D-glycero-D-manno-heptose 1,7-bisphosphate phosphatase
MRPAVFLDRDGTMIHDAHYLRRLEDVVWFSSTIDAIRLLNRAGFLVCVITNQGGVGLGVFPEAFVLSVHAMMAQTLEAGGAHVDGWFYCPHHPAATIEELRVDCTCRKPGIGMIHQACERFEIDVARSFVIGDKQIDIDVAARVGARGILVRTGYGQDIARAHRDAVPGAAFVAADLMEATSWLLGESGHPRPQD